MYTITIQHIDRNDTVDSTHDSVESIVDRIEILEQAWSVMQIEGYKVLDSDGCAFARFSDLSAGYRVDEVQHIELAGYNVVVEG